MSGPEGILTFADGPPNNEVFLEDSENLAVRKEC